MDKTRFVLFTVLLLLLVSFLFAGACDYITGEALTASVPTHFQKVTIKDVSPAEAYAIIGLNAGHANFTIIDVRTPEEYAAGHIPGALNRDYRSPTFKDEIAKFDKGRIYLIYCRSGVRSASARDVMKELGFQQIYNISGGITDWIAQGLPVVK
jgi:rhodanese-related sulfurtransferase